MRRTWGLATAAVLAAGTFGVQAGDASAQTASTPHPGAAAITALQQHPGAARATAGQAFRVTDTITDRDGSTHVRMQRTLDGVPVLGGDLVVHEGPQDGWRGVSQTLAAPVDLSTSPAVSAARASAQALAPAQATQAIAGM